MHWFVEKHSDQLGTYWARALNSARGQAVNPATNTAWFNLLGGMIEKENIDDFLMWAADESGFQPGGGTCKCVMGAKGKKVQHQQADGNHENITVIVTICANGTSIAPAVLFKGKAFLTKWQQDNSTKAT